MCARSRPSSAATPRTCSSAPPGSSASRSTDRPVHARHARGSPPNGAPTAAPTPPRAIMTTDTVPQGGRRSSGDGFDRRRHGQGRGDARPEHGDDAGRAHHRRRRRARPTLQAALQHAVSRHRSTASSSTAARRRTTPCSCSPAARAGHRSISTAFDARGGRGVCRRSPRRWRATPRGTPRSSRIDDRPAPRPTTRPSVAARKLADEPAREVLASTARIRTGAGCCRSWARPASRSTPTPITVAYGGVVVSQGLAPTGRTTRSAVAEHMPRVHLDRATSASARARPGAHQRPHPRVRRREHGHVVTEPRSDAAGPSRRPRRGAAVHPPVLRHDGRREVRRQRHGRRRPGRAVRRGHRAAALASASAPSSCTAAVRRSAT